MELNDWLAITGALRDWKLSAVDSCRSYRILCDLRKRGFRRYRYEYL